jgi:DNA-binding beta-propeller fold protein YncE
MGHGSVLTAELRAGSFPREERLSPDGKTLYVTNFASNQLEIVDLTRLDSPGLSNRLREPWSDAEIGRRSRKDNLSFRAPRLGASGV